jgi:hypothetical protein
MKPFHASLSAHLLLLAVAVVTIGGGLISLLALDPNVGPAIVLAAGGVIAFVGIVLGVYDHPAHVLMAALLGPLGLWPMTMVVLFASTRPTFGWGLIALGLLPVCFAIAGIVRAPKRTSAPVRATQRAHV